MLFYLFYFIFYFFLYFIFFGCGKVMSDFCSHLQPVQHPFKHFTILTQSLGIVVVAQNSVTLDKNMVLNYL